MLGVREPVSGSVGDTVKILIITAVIAFLVIVAVFVYALMVVASDADDLEDEIWSRHERNKDNTD